MNTLFLWPSLGLLALGIICWAVPVLRKATTQVGQTLVYAGTAGLLYLLLVTTSPCNAGTFVALLWIWGAAFFFVPLVSPIHKALMAKKSVSSGIWTISFVLWVTFIVLGYRHYSQFANDWDLRGWMFPSFNIAEKLNHLGISSLGVWAIIALIGVGFFWLMRWIEQGQAKAIKAAAEAKIKAAEGEARYAKRVSRQRSPGTTD